MPEFEYGELYIHTDEENECNQILEKLLGPEGSYYFTETRLKTARTDSPLTLTLRLGVRLSF